MSIETIVVQEREREREQVTTQKKQSQSQSLQSLKSQLSNKTEPLKIPLPKAASKLTQPSCNSSTGLSVITSTVSDQGQSGYFANKDKCFDDHQQIFSIESRHETPLLQTTQKDDYTAFGTGYRDNSGEQSNGGHENKDGEDDDSSGNQENYGDSEFDSDYDGNSPFYSSDIDSDGSDEPPLLWNFADYFANLPGNDWCVKIPQCFIEDEFNLFELPNVFKCPLTLTDNHRDDPNEDSEDYSFEDLIDFITVEDLTEDPIPKISLEMLEDSIVLYKLIHQRFIMTKSGLQAMWERFEHQSFGTCPRYFCHDQPLLPVGFSSLPKKDKARVYCLNCQDLYAPMTSKHANMDGIPFGPTFAHFFVRTVLYGNEMKALENRKGARDWQVYVPKIYGFKIFKMEANSIIRSERPRDFK